MISHARFTPRPTGCPKIQQLLHKFEVTQIGYVEIWVAGVKVSAREVGPEFDVDALIDRLTGLYAGLPVSVILGVGEGKGDGA